MEGGSSEGSEARFASYVAALGIVLGHADRQQPMDDYCLGLLMPIERKSVEPMAAVTAPAQSLPSRRRGSLRSINRCFILLATRRGRTPRCWARACPRESGGGRAGAAGDRMQRAGRGLDHRRHGLSQEGTALGRGDPAILRSARQAGQLPEMLWGERRGNGTIVAANKPTGCPMPQPNDLSRSLAALTRIAR
jgi:hypothetical protein